MRPVLARRTGSGYTSCNTRRLGDLAIEAKTNRKPFCQVVPGGTEASQSVKLLTTKMLGLFVCMIHKLYPVSVSFSTI